MAGDWSVQEEWSFTTQIHLPRSLCLPFCSKPPKIPTLPFPSSLLTFPATSTSFRVPGLVLCRATPCFSDVYFWFSLTVGVLNFRRTLHCGTEQSFPCHCVTDQTVWESSRWHSLSSTPQSSSLGNGTLGLGVSHQARHQILALRSTEALLCCSLTVGPHIKQRSLLVGRLDQSRGSVLCDRSARYCFSYFCCASQPSNVVVFRWQWIWQNASSLLSFYRWVGQQLARWVAGK